MSRPAAALLAVIAVAAAIRMLFLVQLSRSDLSGMLPLDMRFYWELAAQLASGGGPPAGGLTFNPLYPAFLAAIFKIFGEGFLAARILQSLAGIATICLTFLCARMLAGGNERNGVSSNIAGLAAAVLVLFYPQMLLYEGSILATTLVTLIMAASLATALAISRVLQGGPEIRITGRRIPPPAAAAALGIMTGAGIMGRPNLFLLLAPLLLVWLFAAGRGARKGRRLALIYAAGLVLALLPASIYNAWSTGSLSPVTSHGGINLYVGNMKGAKGLYDPPAGMRLDMRGLIEDSKAIAERDAGRELTYAEASAYWYALARERIVTDTWGWTRLLGRKFLLYWNASEYGDMIDVETLRGECPVFAFLVVRFALISTLALTGTLLVAWKSRSRWPYLIFLSASVASIVLFYFNTRYRLPSIPALAAGAGWMTAWAAGRISRRRWKEAGGAVAAAALVFVFITGREMVVVNRSAMYTFMGNHYAAGGQDQKALEAFAEAFRLEPDRMEGWINYARILRKTGKPDRAREFYSMAWNEDPDFPRLALEYGSLLEEQGDSAGAEKLYIHAYRSGRQYEVVMACKLLSRMAYSRGRVDESIEWIKRAIEAAPDDEDLKKLLARLEGA